MISTAILTYNHAQYIAEAIEGALMQSVSCDYEIVIGDDCSTDGTQDIILDFYRQNQKRIRPILRDHNSGLEGKNNFLALLKACKGKYIASMDGDDYWTSPHKLRRQQQLMDAHPDWSMCFHSARYLYEDGRYHIFSPPQKKAFYTYSDLLLYTTFIPSCSVMYRAGLFDTFPAWFFDTPVIGDVGCFLLHAELGNVGFLNDILGVYRRQPAGYWSQLSMKEWCKRYYDMCQHLMTQIDSQYVPILQRRMHRDRACYQSLSGEYWQAHKSLWKYITEPSFDSGIFNRDFALALMTIYFPNILKSIMDGKLMTKKPVRDRHSPVTENPL